MTDLTIREVKTTLLQMPWMNDPWLAGHALGPMRDLVVVEITTQSGITGMGYLHLLNLPLQRTIGACIAEAMAPRIIGRDASAIEAIWRDLWRTTLTGGRGGVAMMAQSAIDIALWDILGKAAGMPLHRLWGHYRSEIPIYGSGCFRGARGDGMIAKAKRYIEQGYRAIKMQVAHIGDLNTDLDNVRRMREAVGPDIDIMIDVNMGWSADIAITMGRKFEEYDIYWLEEPVLADDYAGYLRCAEALDMRVVGGETHFGRADLKPFLENPRLPILQPDPMRGGMTELRKIHRVIMKRLPDAPHEVLLVLDGTIGQNALSQARTFSAAVPVTGIVVTKLDGTAKGGIVVAVHEALNVPVKFVGLGEQIGDLEPFDAGDYAKELVEA